MLGFWRVPDCEELVGGFTGDDGIGFNVIYFTLNFPFTHFPKMIPSISYVARSKSPALYVIKAVVI